MILPPKPETLRKYGLDADTWNAILERQGGVCAICRRVPSTGRFVVDHDHVPRWKNLPPEERRKRVRGVLCFWCNYAYVGRAITVAKARNVVAYLEAYEARRRA